MSRIYFIFLGWPFSTARGRALQIPPCSSLYHRQCPLSAPRWSLHLRLQPQAQQNPYLIGVSARCSRELSSGRRGKPTVVFLYYFRWHLVQPFHSHSNNRCSQAFPSRSLPAHSLRLCSARCNSSSYLPSILRIVLSIRAYRVSVRLGSTCWRQEQKGARRRLYHPPPSYRVSEDSISLILQLGNAHCFRDRDCLVAGRQELGNLSEDGTNRGRWEF